MASDDHGRGMPTRTGTTTGAGTLAWVGRLAAPPLAVLVFALLPTGPEGLSTGARATAAIVVLMAVLWMTEAMPLPATALLPVVLFPLVGALPIEEATAAYANEVIFLFLGGFLIARAMERWGLHRRIALAIVARAGDGPGRIVAGFMVATAFLSMWISNTATVVMMFPIALTVTGMVGSDDSDKPGVARDSFAICLMLAVAYSASIGSLATLIGTPPNLLLRAFVEDQYGVTIGFGQWMVVGVPLALIFLPIAWFALTRVYPPGEHSALGGREALRRERELLGPIGRAERTVLVVFSCVVAAWVLRGPLTSWGWAIETMPWLANVSDAGIAVAGALVLFAIPLSPRRGVFVLDWEQARGLPWGILILVGGGLSMAAAVRANGLDEWIGARFSGLAGLATIVVIIVVVGAMILLTEVTSNTATAATLLPVLAGTAMAIGIDPLTLLVPAALAASCAFMMPVATPPNAIVFASGRLSVAQMARAGVVLNVTGVVLITLVAVTLVPLVFGAVAD
jgi:solute carrier family 13 (sodium-dependent dicarboxylate transporter), member 2/3/5